MNAEDARNAALSGELILVDIRTPEEWQQTGIGDAAIPLDMRQSDFLDKLTEMSRNAPDKDIALICATGGRTGYVTTVLQSRGWTNLIDVSEGMQGSKAGPGWLNRQLPTKTYQP